MAAVARRSLVAARDLAAGTPLTRDAIEVKRPGTGLPPTALPDVIGRSVRTAIVAGTILTEELLA
mgnify:FL=1